MLNLDPELIRQLHRERHGRLTAHARPDLPAEQRGPARSAPRLRIALPIRLRRPQIQLGEDAR
jgi:hypothetical protein